MRGFFPAPASKLAGDPVRSAQNDNFEGAPPRQKTNVGILRCAQNDNFGRSAAEDDLEGAEIHKTNTEILDFVQNDESKWNFVQASL